jgi:hypothetical protein
MIWDLVRGCPSKPEPLPFSRLTFPSQVGKNVTDIKVGDKVGVGCISDSCMSCLECEQVRD